MDLSVAPAAAASASSSSSGAAASSSTRRGKRPADEAGDDEQPAPRRGPPRHFHAGPRREQPGLHRDALQSIFEFLKQEDFALVTRISKDWLDVATRMPSRGWVCRCATDSELYRLFVSPLRKHITCLEYSKRDVKQPVLGSSQLLLISERMTHLSTLACSIEVAGMVAPRWPSRLTTLALRLVWPSSMQSVEEFASAAAMIGRSIVENAPKVASMDVSCWQGDTLRPLPPALFAPLLQLPLTSLRLHGETSPAACQVVRQMQRLTIVHLHNERYFIDLLADDGPVPPLEAVYVYEQDGFSSKFLDVTEETLQLLLKLPTLRALFLNVCIRDPSPLLPVLTKLHSLTLAFDPPCDLNLLVAALKQCAALTKLVLDADSVTEFHLSAILPSMPLLQAFRVSSAVLTSLAFLAQAPHLASTLERLTVTQCNLSPTDIRFLKPLRTLQQLDLDRCFTTPLDAFTLSMMTPGAESFMRDWWPNLRKMQYVPKPDNE